MVSVYQPPTGWRHSWVGREALVTQASGQVSWLRLNSKSLGSGFPSTVRRKLLIPFYGGRD